MEYNKTVTLKNGEKCVLRNGTEADGQEMLDIFMLAHAQTDYLLTYPDECTHTAEEEANFLKKKAESAREIQLLAEIGGKAVGSAGIDAVGNRYKLCHRASFGISVDRDHWGLGIGRALTNACIECARRAGYVQLNLEVVRENESAIALYKSVGFVEFGADPKGFRSRVSGFQELVYMRLEL